MTPQTSPLAPSTAPRTESTAHEPMVLAVPNGTPLPTAPLPRAQRRRKRLWVILPAAATLLVVAIVVVWLLWFRGPQARPDLVTYRVEFKDLQLKIVERGSLEAKESHDVKCEVKSGSRGSPKIEWVVDNGAYVHKGDLLVDIDDSYLQEQAQAKKIDRDKAEADKIAAEQSYPVKQVAIKLAEQNLEKWIKGDFPQQLHKAESDILDAKSILQQQQDRTNWVSRMVKKGYMTATQEQAEEDNLHGDELNLQNFDEVKKVLVDYTDPVQRKTLENAIKQARVDERTAYATMESDRAVFVQQEALYQDLLDQIKQCKIYAPNEGIVVYSVPEQTRMGSGATQSIVAQGEPVQYGQKLMSIPDLRHMLVNIRVHEAFINQMRNGLPCQVRVDAVPGKMLKGQVKNIANAAAPQDWLSPDVKVYQAYVEIEDEVAKLKLKPGLSAVTTIFTDTKAPHVLAVPVQAVVSPLEKGGKPRVFVMAPHGPEARDIDVGMSDEKFIEVKDGLHEGDEVVLNPRGLLSDKEKKPAGKDDSQIVPTDGMPGGRGGRGSRGGRGAGGGAGYGAGGDETPATGGGGRGGAHHKP